MNLLWISGWGLPTVWLTKRIEAAFPGDIHTVVPPTQEAVTLLREPADFDRIAGYSLGAFLLLKSLAPNPENSHVGTKSAALLAPFFSFTAESGRGGRIPRSKVIFLLRWIKRDPLAALADFYRRSRIPEPPALSALPYPVDDLLWGLECLIDGEAGNHWPAQWIGLCGGADPLLDAEQLKALAPTLQVLPEAGHEPEPMLNELREIWRS